MALEPLKVLTKPRQGGSWEERVVALFNPNQISIQKSSNLGVTPARERNTPTSTYNHGNPATLSMELFFDTYEAGTDVREYTDKLYDLVVMDGEGHQPLLCKLVWGKATFFQGILRSLNQRFTLFLPDGLPVRATLGCSFQESKTAEEDKKEAGTSSADVAKTRVIKRGDTLSAIAAEEYRDPGLWRPIAEANDIDDPVRLEPGQRLQIPALRPR